MTYLFQNSITDPSGESPIYPNCSKNNLCVLEQTIASISNIINILMTYGGICDYYGTSESYHINLSAYYMIKAKAGVGEQFGQAILSAVDNEGQEWYYDINLSPTTSKKDALRTDSTTLFHSAEGVCMQGTAKLDLGSGKVYYLYCKHKGANNKDTTFSISPALYPAVEAFETAARAKQGSEFIDGEKVAIPVLGNIFKNFCNASNHDSNLTIRSVGGGLSQTTLDVFVGEGDPRDNAFRLCMNTILSVEDTVAYVQRRIR